jgi:hypothetical protein
MRNRMAGLKVDIHHYTAENSFYVFGEIEIRNNYVTNY